MNIQNNEEIIKLKEEINKLQVELSFKIQEIKQYKCLRSWNSP